MALLLLLRPALASELPLISWEGATMGCVYTVKIAGTNLPSAKLEAIKSQIEKRLHDLNRQISHFQPDSELSRFNRAPARTPFAISPDFARVARLALEMSGRSQGAYV